MDTTLDTINYDDFLADSELVLSCDGEYYLVLEVNSKGGLRHMSKESVEELRNTSRSVYVSDVKTKTGQRMKLLVNESKYWIVTTPIGPVLDPVQ